ncbi:MAG TPA: beta-galactosidase [Anaerolineae bacterium]|nr:beta-galactosidase [Anaerolineae bacterium]
MDHESRIPADRVSPVRRRTFTTDAEHFLLDGQPYRVLSGAMHYFRVPPAAWRDRLRKLRAMGLNTVETYVAWNLHEPEPGCFCFDGALDLVAYLRAAAEEGLFAIVRPGPYICSEWEFGGLPAWLLRDPAMRLRCSYPPYLAAVDRYLDALLPLLEPLQVTRGGPILAMQVENEYGSYGNDQGYLQHLADGMGARGIDVLLFMSDGPTDVTLRDGAVPGLLKTVNFARGVQEAFAKLREHQPEGPILCTEFWDGWFDHWGGEHQARPADETAATLDEMLAAGASVSFYMAHGGTNFGFMNGANSFGTSYLPIVTSYDYDAPLSEAGDPTDKYWALREVIGRYEPLPDAPLPEPSPKAAYGPVDLPESVALFDALGALSAPVPSAAPLTMEALGQNYGFLLYRTRLAGPQEAFLTLRGLHDRAQIFLDGQLLGTLDRTGGEADLYVQAGPGSAVLDILVENMGRVHFGPDLADRKGIVEGVLAGQQTLFGWTHYPLPLDDLSRLRFAPSSTMGGPAFYRGRFAVDVPRDTFLALPGWTKGVCWVNGFNLGRYWGRVPQRTLYVPASLLSAGENELVVLELHGTERRTVEFRDLPELG